MKPSLSDLNYLAIKSDYYKLLYLLNTHFKLNYTLLNIIFIRQLLFFFLKSINKIILYLRPNPIVTTFDTFPVQIAVGGS